MWNQVLYPVKRTDGGHINTRHHCASPFVACAESTAIALPVLVQSHFSFGEVSLGTFLPDSLFVLVIVTKAHNRFPCHWECQPILKSMPQGYRMTDDWGWTFSNPRFSKTTNLTGACQHRRRFEHCHTNQARPQPLPTRFEHLNVTVKSAPHVAVAEAQYLLVIKRVLRDEVPVPEVYGRRFDRRDVFIYKQYVRGETLRNRWSSLSIAGKISVCDHIRQITTYFAASRARLKWFVHLYAAKWISSLRMMIKSSSGSINRQHLLGIVF